VRAGRACAGGSHVALNVRGSKTKSVAFTIASHMPMNAAIARNHARPHIGVKAGDDIQPPGIGHSLIDDIGMCIA